MGKILISGGSGGINSDDTTVTSSHVLSGDTYLGADTDDEVGTGTMPNNGAVSQTLNCGGSYTIPEGYHDGSGKVTANSLSSQTSATAAAADVLTGKTAYVNGSKITGTMATLAGGTYTPKAAQQTISCSGKKMTSNIIIAGDSDLVAANIKKGVNIFGITGTWEGWVPTTADLYYNGTNNAGFSGSVSSNSGDTFTFQSQQIYFKSYYFHLTSSKSYNISGNSKLVITAHDLWAGSGSNLIIVYVGGTQVGSFSGFDEKTSVSITIDPRIASSGVIKITFAGNTSSSGMKLGNSGYITKISLR